MTENLGWKAKSIERAKENQRTKKKTGIFGNKKSITNKVRCNALKNSLKKEKFNREDCFSRYLNQKKAHGYSYPLVIISLALILVSS